MATAIEPKLRVEDKDEWIFQSMNRYTHLYMFDLEFPVDAFEIINDTSLCLAGLQTYSKNCELIQLSIPPKLLPANMEDGLCKDRDFNIISGGYSPLRIAQIKGIHSNPRFLATIQVGKTGVALFELGDENHAVAIPKGYLNLPRLSPSTLTQTLATQGNQIMLGNNLGKHITEWKIDAPNSPIQHEIPESLSGVTKIKFWDEHSLAFSTSEGKVSIYDIRSDRIGVKVQSSKLSDFGTDEVPLRGEATAATKITNPTGKGNIGLQGPSIPDLKETPPSPDPKSKETLNSLQDSETNKILAQKINPNPKEILVKEASAGPSPQSKILKETPLPEPKSFLIWSFDSVTPLHKIGMVDSCGGYETFDVRKVSAGTKTANRVLLPDCTAKEVLGQKFNLEYEPYHGADSEVKFIVTGMKDETVQVYRDKSGITTQVFSHDGHSSLVTHATWHPLTKNLLFSTSANSMLHAWQYIEK